MRSEPLTHDWSLPAKAKINKMLVLYLVMIAGALLLLQAIFNHGKALETYKAVAGPAAQAGPAAEAASENVLRFFLEGFGQNLNLPLSVQLLQIFVIVVFVQFFGFLAKSFRQPAVVGEIIAGIVLGPSVLGLFFPGAGQFLFPPESLKNLQLISQVGLVLFMCVVGMELDVRLLKNKVHAAVVISHVSIAFPFVLGAGLAYFIYADLGPGDVSFLSFGLFMGIAMSITAFPVLSRIIQERGLTKTPLGAISLVCAATDDVTAWCILAVVIAVVKSGTALQAVATIVLTALYVGGMILLLKPALRRLAEKHRDHLDKWNSQILVLALLLLFASAYIGEMLGVHALFGAFMAGVVIPEAGNLRGRITGKIKDISLILLLPIFFVLTGLRTQIGLLDSGGLWLVCGLIVVLAVAGKFGGSALAARSTGMPWRESLGIGVLMNTRGLMELIVLNIGYELGIVTPEIFAMMVIMALVTTFMTGPALDLIDGARNPARRPLASGE